MLLHGRCHPSTLRQNLPPCAVPVPVVRHSSLCRTSAWPQTHRPGRSRVRRFERTRPLAPPPPPAYPPRMAWTRPKAPPSPSRKRMGQRTCQACPADDVYALPNSDNGLQISPRWAAIPPASPLLTQSPGDTRVQLRGLTFCQRQKGPGQEGLSEGPEQNGSARDEKESSGCSGPPRSTQPGRWPGGMTGAGWVFAPAVLEYTRAPAYESRAAALLGLRNTFTTLSPQCFSMGSKSRSFRITPQVQTSSPPARDCSSSSAWGVLFPAKRSTQTVVSTRITTTYVLCATPPGSLATEPQP